MGKERKPKMYSYVFKATVKPARRICTEVLGKVRERLQDRGTRVQIRPVGSARVNLVTRNGDDPFDLDFDILVFGWDEKPGVLKDTILDAVRKETEMYGFRKIQDSTSAVTCIHYQESDNKVDFHMDLGIILMQDHSEGRRLIHDKVKGRYFLNEPVQYNELKQHETAIRDHGMVNELRKVYLEKKNFYLKEQDQNHPSFVVYVEAVNQVFQKVQEKEGQKCPREKYPAARTRSLR